MSDNGIDLEKKSDVVGSPPTKKRGGGGVFGGILAVTLLLLAVMIVVAATRGKETVQAPKTTAVATPEAVPQVVERTAVIGPDPRVDEEEATAAADDEALPVQDVARQKLCTSIAESVIDAANASSLQQSLIVYNLNRCSNEYIRNADASRRGLTEDELTAIKDDHEVGDITIEDR